MSLAHYHKKRTFSKTPEPKGSAKLNTGKKNKGPLTFVIQKHEASHLHYDFRLELDGVLKSWAVPKGPSLNPDDKRLAMMVEDHPMEYAGFEGIIPKGNYGAGTVMVWDNGVYSPYPTVQREQAKKMLKQQLAKGHLTFVLLGEKLKGEFALVRTPNAGENAWLLIKARDEYSDAKDILTSDKSVLSGRSMNEIATQAVKKNEIWYSKPKKLDLDDAPQSLIPHAVKPMLAQAVDEPFDKSDWLFELKLDGFRAVAEIKSGDVKLYSRNGQNFHEKFSPIAKSLTKFPGDAVLDGEIVVVDESGKPMFQWLQDYHKTKRGELRYYIFDILYFDGHSLENLPLIKRKEILKHLLPPLPHLAFCEHIEETGIAFFKQAAKLHLEGIIAKNVNSTYLQGFRTYDWLKIKTHTFVDAIICGFTEPRGGRKYFGSLVLGIVKNNKLQYIGHVGGGFDEKTLEEIYTKLKSLEQTDSPFEKIPQSNTPVTWINPVLTCEVTFTSWTEDHIMRHPVFVGLKEKDISPDELLSSPRSRESGNTERSQNAIETETPPAFSVKPEANEKKLKLSNLSKIYWPDEGFTKGDVIDYYSQISRYILPYLTDRPESLLRHPDGITGKKFFQKDLTIAPAWIKQVSLYSESVDKTIHWVICNDKATLLYMANLGCIEINPWSSRIMAKDHPDYLSLDLDPNGAPFSEVVTTAKHIKTMLDTIETEAFIKTSGKSGLHIFIPLGAKYTFEQTRQFAELLARAINKELPETTSIVRDPKKRANKIYIDYLQNRMGQTLSSAYSLRPVPGAQVSTPIDWDELNNKLHPSNFTIETIFKRLKTKGDIWKGLYEHKGIDMLKSLDLLIKN